METKNELTLKERLALERCIRDPALFARHILGVDLWEGEIEILQSIEVNQRTAVKSCHGAGKTFALAVATLWWLARHSDGIVLTTAPTHRQVTTILWRTIHELTARSRISFPEFNQGSIKLRDEGNFALGLSTNRPANFQGYHGRNV